MSCCAISLGGGGGGGGGTPLSKVFFADVGLGPGVGDGSIANPVRSLAELVALVEAVEDGQGIGYLVPGHYGDDAIETESGTYAALTEAWPGVFETREGEGVVANFTPAVTYMRLALWGISCAVAPFPRSDGVLTGTLVLGAGTVISGDEIVVDTLLASDAEITTTDNIFCDHLSARNCTFGDADITLETGTLVELSECTFRVPITLTFAGDAGVVLCDQYTADQIGRGLLTVVNGVVRVRGVTTFTSQTLVTLNSGEIGAFDFPVPGLEEGMGATLTIWQEPGPILDLQIMSQKSKANALEVWLKNEGASQLEDETVVVQGTAFYSTVLG